MPPFLLSSIEILIGIVILFWGGELFVKGSVALSLILGIPQLVIGLTVVSLGTSAPELFVSVSSVLKGSAPLAVSNVIGSNIFNIMVVLGTSSLIMPLKVESRLVRRDVPLLLAVSAAVWGMASSGRITWQSGIALFIALIINTLWEIRTVREEPAGVKDAEPEIDLENTSKSIIKSILLLIVGITLLNIGSKILISGATSAATLLGVSEVIIGLTIVSAGTSMPELITSLVAAFKGRTDLAIGNVVGSNLLNQLLVLGSSSIISGKNGLIIDQILINKDMPIMILTTLALNPIFWSNGKISRGEGGILVFSYFLYILDQLIPNILPDLHNGYRLFILCIVIPCTAIYLIFESLKHYTFIKEKP